MALRTLGAPMFLAYPVGGASLVRGGCGEGTADGVRSVLARTAVNYQCGSKTPLNNLLPRSSWLVLLFLTSASTTRPMPFSGKYVLRARCRSALIRPRRTSRHHCSHLADRLHEIRRLWRVDEKGDLLQLLLVLLATVSPGGAPSLRRVCPWLVSL